MKTDQKAPGLFVSLLPIFIMMLLLVVGYGIYHIKAQVLLITAAFLTGIIARMAGFSWQEMEQGIVESIHKALPAILIMLTVGVMIGSWIAAGTIPMIIFYGLKLITPKYFLFTASLVCSLVSLATGTSWGTIGTLGVAFIGIATAQGIPMGPAAGAIVAGAYFGDKMSPFSDVTNLAPVAAGSQLFDHIKHMMWSAVPAWLVGLLVYFFYGLRFESLAAQSETINTITTTLQTHFTFNLLLLLPLVVVFYFAIAKKPVLPGMLLSSVLAVGLAMYYQGASLVEVARAVNTGYQPNTGVEAVDRLLSRGGMMSMMEVQLVAFTAFSFSGIMQKSGMLERIFQSIAPLTKKIWSLVLTTVGMSVMTALITGSSYLSMIVPGELLAKAYQKANLAAKNLSRIIEEAGAIIVPLIPYSMAGVYVTGTIGVSPFTYLPWAIMNYLSVVILIIYGFSGFTMVTQENS